MAGTCETRGLIHTQVTPLRTCFCAYTHSRVHTHRYVCIHTYTCAYAHIRVHTHTYVCIHTYTCAYTHMRVHTHEGGWREGGIDPQAVHRVQGTAIYTGGEVYIMCVHMYMCGEGYVCEYSPLSCTRQISLQQVHESDSCVCTRICVYAHICVCMHTYVCVCTRICVYAHVSVCMHTYLCVYTHTHVHTHDLYTLAVEMCAWQCLAQLGGRYTHIYPPTHIYMQTHLIYTHLL